MLSLVKIVDEDKERSPRKKPAVVGKDHGGSANKITEARSAAGLDWMVKEPARPAQKSQDDPKEDGKSALHAREMNPYLKSGGDGLPDDVKVQGSQVGSAPLKGAVGDAGASWRLKAIKRARERAVDEGKDADSMLEERWGRAAAEFRRENRGKPASFYAHRQAAHQRRQGAGDDSEGKQKEVDLEGGIEDHGKAKDDHNDDDGDMNKLKNRGPRDYLRDVGSGRSEMKVPKANVSWRKVGGDAPDRRREVDRPWASGRDKDPDRSREREGPPPLDRQHGRDRDGDRDRDRSRDHGREHKREHECAQERGRGRDRERERETEHNVRGGRDAEVGFIGQQEKEKGKGRDRELLQGVGSDAGRVGNQDILIEPRNDRHGDGRRDTAQEKILPLPTHGSISAGQVAKDETHPSQQSLPVVPKASNNQSAAEALRARLRGGGKPQSSAPSASSVRSAQAAAASAYAPSVALASANQPVAKGKVERYDAKEGSRVRYFRDDDDKSLQNLVVGERLSSRSGPGGGGAGAYEGNLVRNVLKNVHYRGPASADDEYDHDVGAEEFEKKGKKRRQGQNVRANLPALGMQGQGRDQCHFCFESEKRNRELTIAVGGRTYLMVTPGERLAPGHCFIVPTNHVPSSRDCDEDVWEEMRNFKKCLIRMFHAEKKAVLFIETATRVSGNKTGHCVIEAVPVPQAVALDAPLFFRKAMDEAEDEWSQHNAKRVIDTQKNKCGLRHSIPQGFPYFHVEFDLQGGYLHPIDDVSSFPRNFGRNLLRGMLEQDDEENSDGDASTHRQGFGKAAAGSFKKENKGKRARESDAEAAKQFRKEWEPFDWTKMLE